MYVYRTKTRLGRLIFRYANIRNQRCKKRVLEFVMNLDTLNNEKKKEELKTKETKIKKDWEKIKRMEMKERMDKSSLME